MNWDTVILEPVKNVLVQVGNFISSLILIIIILIIGWLIAKLVKTIVERFFKLTPLDNIVKEAKIEDILKKGGISSSLAELLGNVGYWIVLLITAVIAVSAIGLTTAADLLNQIILYVPNVIAAIFILVLGLFAANILNSIIQTVTANAGISQAKLLGKIVEVVTIIFAVIIALEQLQIAGILMLERIILIILAAIGLAVGLAFGLGCKDIAGKFIADLIEKVKSKK